MKKIPALLLAICLAFFVTCTAYATAENGENEEPTTEHPETTEYPDEPTRQPDLVSNAAIVIDSISGQILYEKNAQEKKYPASITKIMTTILALEKSTNLSETITISENAVWDVDRGSSLIGLDVGEKITLEDCLYAAMLYSDNSCAYALAEYVAGDIKSFADVMNAKAKEIGCENTHFVTPNGLHDDNHYTCAHDMALITKYALQNEKFREIAGTLSYVVPATNLADEERTLWNGNKMIKPAEDSYYEYCEGGKTGYTTAANNTLVTFSKKDGLELICVIMDCDGWKYSYTDSKALYNYCYNNYTYFYPLSDFSFDSEHTDEEENNKILQNYYNSLNHELMDLSVDKDFSLLVNKSLDTTQIKKEITLYDEAKDDILGEFSFIYDGAVLGTTQIKSSTPLLSSSMAKKDKKQTSSIWKKISKIALIVLAVIVAIIVLILFSLLLGTIVRHVKHRRSHRYRYRRKRKKRDDDYFF